MTIREAVFAVLLAGAVTLIALGVAMIHRPSALIVAGAALVPLSWLLLSEAPRE